MTTTYRASKFVAYYVAALLVLASFLIPHVSSLAVTVLVAFGIIGLPFTFAKVVIGDEGVAQRVLLRHSSAKWADIISWHRSSVPGSDGPDKITITTRSGSFALSHNCVFGKRLDAIESELRRRIAQPAHAANPR